METTKKSHFYRQVILPNKTWNKSPKDLKKYEKQPVLRPLETDKYRNSFQRQLCVEMLREGYHQSFREILAILAWQKEDRAKLGAEHPLFRRPLLEGEPEKLKYLCEVFTKIEAAERKHLYSMVYAFYLELAKFFSKTEDRWLSDSFYQKCLKVAQSNAQMDPVFAAEAYLNVALADEQRGELIKALKHLEEYRRLSEQSIRLRIDANLQLTRVYLKLAERRSIKDRLDHVLNAYQCAQLSEDEQTENETAYRLGEVYLQQDQIDQALIYFHRFYDYCRKFRDYDGFGDVSQALAICYQKKGDLTKSMFYLNTYLARVSDHQNDRQFVRASSTLGLIQMTQNQYQSALISLREAYSLSLANRSPDLDRYRVMYGIARGMKFRQLFNEKLDRMMMEDLIQWKSFRNERVFLNQS